MKKKVEPVDRPKAVLTVESIGVRPEPSGNDLDPVVHPGRLTDVTRPSFSAIVVG